MPPILRGCVRRPYGSASRCWRARHPAAKGLGRGIIIARLAIWLIIAFEALVATGIIAVPGSSLSLSWVVYVIVGYVVLYELPSALAGRDDVALGHWRVVGWFVANALLFDLIGQLGDLWEVPIAGSFTYDNLVHVTSMPFAICAIVWATAMTLRRRYRLEHVPGSVPAFVVMGALSLTVVHELIELAIDMVAGAGAGTGIAPGDIYDTHLDLLYDTLGIALFVIGLVVRNALAAGVRRAGETTT